MKRILLIIILVLFFAYLKASSVYLIETANPISGIVLINNNTNHSDSLFSCSANNTSYRIEVADLENLYIAPMETVKLQMYCLGTEISSSWQEIEKGISVSIKFIFSDNVTKNVSISEFYIKNFISNPLTNSAPNLRGEKNSFFYVTNYYNFISPDSLYVTWRSDYRILRLKIIDKTNFKHVFQSNSYNDTILSFASLPEEAKKLFKSSHEYLLTIKANSNKAGTQTTKTFNFNFEFKPIYFSINQPVQFFINKEDIKFSWHNTGNKIDFFIYNANNELIYSENNFTNNSIDLKYFISNNINLEQRKEYSIKLKSDNIYTAKKFIYLHN